MPTHVHMSLPSLREGVGNLKMPCAYVCAPIMYLSSPPIMYLSPLEHLKLMSELAFYMRLLTLDKQALIRLLSVLTFNFRRC